MKTVPDTVCHNKRLSAIEQSVIYNGRDSRDAAIEIGGYLHHLLESGTEDLQICQKQLLALFLLSQLLVKIETAEQFFEISSRFLRDFCNQFAFLRREEECRNGFLKRAFGDSKFFTKEFEVMGVE